MTSPLRRSIAVLVAVGTIAAGGCSSDAQAGRSTTTQSPTTTSTTAPEADAYAVGRHSIVLVDSSRPTAADPARDLPAEPDRTLPVLVLYPATGLPSSPSAPVDEAEPADGAFPLVVFSHGVNGTGPVYEGRIREWARAGYVVVAPTFPRSSGPGAKIIDYPNQPADVSFLIDHFTDLPDADPLAGHIDTDHVAVAGHSLGAATSIGVALATCVADPDIDALVELAGIRAPFGADCPYALDDAIPVLAVHAEDDDVVLVAGSDTLVADLTGRVDYLRFDTGGHSGFLINDGPLVDDVVVAFLDQALKGDDGGLPEARAAAAASGHATFTEQPAPG